MVQYKYQFCSKHILFGTSLILLIICSFEAGNLDNLEIHLRTCEIYQCDECEQRFKSISKIKEHVTEIHKRESFWINHLKMDRNSFSEISEKSYLSNKL